MPARQSLFKPPEIRMRSAVVPAPAPCIDPPELKRRVQAVLPGITELRRSLHRIPETRLEEHETSRRLRELVSLPGIELLPPLLGTDVVGLLRGEAKGRAGSVMLRADIDALPVEDRSGAPWASGSPGRSHACGHDGHMAILVGTVQVLAALRKEFAGSVRFVFQPAEEEAGGGKMLIERGLLDRAPRPEAVFALHGWPGLPAGTVAATPGPAMAGQDRFRITVEGKGGHAAVPHRAVDPVVVSAQLITVLQAVVSRSVDPIDSAVVSVCTIHGGTASNVIPDRVVMEGTTRYFEPRVQELLRRRLEQIVASTCAAAGATGTLEYSEGYIPLVNDAGKVELLKTVVRAYLGEAAWVPELPRTMGAEDFAFYLARVPGVFLRLGLGEDSPSLHNPQFDFNDAALEAGITVMAALALESLAAA
jgi:hippurate hydrolase